MYNCEGNSDSSNVSLNPFQNFSNGSLRNFVQDEQLQKNLVIIPTFVYLVVMFVLGTVGNPLIILVYTRERKRTATRYFIVSIAVVDFLATIVTIPVTCYVNFRSLHMENVYICKLYFFVNFTNASMSAFLLVGVAFVRFRKICFPFGWQVSIVHAGRINIVMAIFCLAFSILHIIVHGRQEKRTEIPGLCTYQCRVDQAYMSTPWPKVVNGIFILIFLSCSGTMCYLYTRIGRQAGRRGEKKVASRSGKSVSSSSGLSSTESARDSELYRAEMENSVDVFCEWDKTDDHLTWEVNKLFQNVQSGATGATGATGLTGATTATDLCEYTQGQTINVRPNFNSCKRDARDAHLQRCEKDKQRKMRPKRRTTHMLLTITIVYVVTNLTTLILMFVRSVADEVILSLRPVWASLYSLFFNLFLLNCAVNPIIYSLWDTNFRNECRKLFRKMTKK
ncbi:hypothetical protein Btru_050653 [Bulinus truncatus]|nr:hypothetical protein Btru_050653 [Bulinus truncatus]